MTLPKQSVGRDEIAILILAAGPSSRLGQPKQQLLIDGSPLLIRTVATALEVQHRKSLCRDWL
jgi:CTP:molybdopterin cytidylyltransferase MocA